MMYVRKIVLLITCIGITSSIARAQSEAMKDVINNLAYYHTKNDLKYLGDAKKSVDGSFKTHADSVDVGKIAYKAVVYSSIVYIDSLNKLNMPDTLLFQTTKMVNKLLGNRKIYRYNVEMNYAKGCLANVYLRKAFDYYNKNNYRLAIDNFNISKKYVPGAKQLDVYLANIYYKLGNYNTAALYYDTILLAKNPKLENIQSAANIHRMLGDTTKSLQIIQRGLDLYTNDRYLLFEEANIYNNQRKYQQLKPLLKDLLTAAPNDNRVIFMAANCCDHLNDLDQAESLYLKAIDVSSNDYDPIFNLGLLYLKKAASAKKDEDLHASLGRSKNWLERAYEIAPNNETCLKALQVLYSQTNNAAQLQLINDKLNQVTN